ncbi:hypothetical protein INT44_008466 [Umbelopsis vinacea]|uniref:Galactose oxidase/kelch, beta-propeller n=1 Tax=Umbelopsis vinacea TaxID=44442 RepID=A0A8H7PYT9_9FUNG|nr:hypothetical protein INT44_008466 [Umbelopsis vinacea]
MLTPVIFILYLFSVFHHVAASDIGPGTRSGHCAFAHQNTLHIFGGSIIGSEALPANHTSFSRFSTLTFPLESNTTRLPWKDLPSREAYNIVNGACAMTDSGYAILIGYDPFDAHVTSPGIQIFNSNDQTWISSIQLNSTINATRAFSQRQGMASTMWAGSVFLLFGGSVSQTNTQDMFVLDTRTWPWSLSQLNPSDNTPVATSHSTMIATSSNLIYHIDSSDTPSEDGVYESTVSQFDPVELEWSDTVRTITTSYPVSFVAGNDSEIILIPKSDNYTKTDSRKKGPLHQFLVESMTKRQQQAQIPPNNVNNTVSNVLTLDFLPTSHNAFSPIPIPGISLIANAGGTVTNLPNHNVVLYGGKAENAPNSQLVVFDSLSHSITNTVLNVSPDVPAIIHPPSAPATMPSSSGKLDRNLIGLCIALAVAGLTVLGLIAIAFIRRRQLRRTYEKKPPVAELPADDDKGSLISATAPDFRRFPVIKEQEDAVTWSDKVRNMLTTIGAAAAVPNEILRRQSQKTKSGKSMEKRKEVAPGDASNSLQVSAPMLASGYTEKQIYCNLSRPPPSRFREHFEGKGRFVSGLSEASASVFSADAALLRSSSYHLGLETASNTQAPSLPRSNSEYKAHSIPGSLLPTSCGGVFSDMTTRSNVPPSYRRSW